VSGHEWGGLIAGRFEVVNVLSHEVYEARDQHSGRIVVIRKIVRSRDGRRVSLAGQDPTALRFEREVRIMSRLSSPHIPAVVGGGVDGGVPYLAMEQTDGMTLADLLANSDGTLPVGWAAAIGRQIAEGLRVAHRAGVVHRDLNPANVLVSPEGMVKLLGFGAGLVLDEVDGRRRAVTPATDLYALGCVMHEMLTGAAPSEVPVCGLRGEVPADLDLLVSRLLAKNPANRPADAGEVSLLLTLVILAQGAIPQTRRHDAVPAGPQILSFAALLRGVPAPRLAQSNK
jgi:serine/threonine protein kinase